jgi:hypothetical protein
MQSSYTVRLKLAPEQASRLRALQALFAEACNLISPMVVSSRCWNRVGLHHLAYKVVRERLPQLGSQMVSNAIYSVSRTCRKVYQDPGSRWFTGRGATAPLPRLKFLSDTPVYFDRHTLSLKGGLLSMFTLDGRLKFQLQVPQELDDRFATDKLREVILQADQKGFVLRFAFGVFDNSDVPNEAEKLDAPELRVIVEPPAEVTGGGMTMHSDQEIAQ